MVEELRDDALVDETLKEMNLFDELLGAAHEGEEIVDEKVGKHENARLAAVAIMTTRDGSQEYLMLVWGGLQTTSGFAFEQQDRVFFPTENTHPIGKSRFMEKLKRLDIVPTDFKRMLYFESEESRQKLQAMLEDKIGEEWPITISLRNDYHEVSVRRRPAVK